MSNPKTDEFPSIVRPISDLFNAMYGLMFVMMGNIFSGRGDQPSSVRTLYMLMRRCLTPAAQYLVQIPIEQGHHAAPTFEAYTFNGDPWSETCTLARAVGQAHPELLETCDLICDLA